MPDYLFLRYRQGFPQRLEDWQWEQSDAEVLWIEFKRPGKKPRPGQAKWHESERAKGALVLVVDSIDQFRKDYFEMGLARKVRS